MLSPRNLSQKPDSIERIIIAQMPDEFCAITEEKIIATYNICTDSAILRLSHLFTQLSLVGQIGWLGNI